MTAFRRALKSLYCNRKQFLIFSATAGVAITTGGVIVGCDESESSRASLWIWGDNRNHNVKYSKNDYYNKPKANAFFEKPVRSVAFGSGSTIVVDYSGNVYGWGDSFGNSVSSSRKPKLLLKGANIVDVKCTESQVVALSKSGSVYAVDPSFETISIGWLYSSRDVLINNPAGGRVIKIETGQHHVIALTDNGTVITCATTEEGNKFGQLGIGTNKLKDETMQDMKKSKFSFTIVPHVTKTVDIACGSNHNVLQDRHNKVFAWGSDYHMQLCLGKSDDIYQNSPMAIKMPSKMTRSTSNTSQDENIQIINSNNLETAKASSTTNLEVYKIAAGGDNTVILRKDDAVLDSFELLLAGHGQHGTLGSGAYTHARGMLYPVNTLSKKAVYDPVTKIQSSWTVSDLYVGNGHIYAVMSDNDVYCWGLNSSGQLGIGKICNIPKPTLILSDTPGLGLLDIPWNSKDMKISLGHFNTAMYKIV